MVAMLDDTHPKLKKQNGDGNEYTVGRIGVHNVVALLESLQRSAVLKHQLQDLLANSHMPDKSNLEGPLSIIEAAEQQNPIWSKMRDISRLIDEQDKSLLGVVAQIVSDSQKNIPMQIQCQAVVYFTDAFGKLKTFDLGYIDSAEKFLRMLRENFRHVGLRKIENREFVLEDTATKEEISLYKKPWNEVFVHGQRVHMSMIFGQVIRPQANSCPNCHTINHGKQDSEVKCRGCDKYFQRIVEKFDDSFPLSQQSSPHNPPKDSQRLARASPVQREKFIGPIFDGDPESDDDPANYERIRIVNKVKWSRQDRSQFIKVSPDGLQLWFSGPRDTTRGDYRGWAIRADHPLSFKHRPNSFSYFETKILAAGERNVACIGFCTKDVALDKLPGWETNSWAYHGDDGRAFAGFIFAEEWDERFGTGDIIGCGLTPNTLRGFFTKNGKFLGAFDLYGLNGRDRLFPMVGMKEAGTRLQTNFGWQRFAYDIERNIGRDETKVKAIRSREV